MEDKIKNPEYRKAIKNVASEILREFALEKAISIIDEYLIHRTMYPDDKFSDWINYMRANGNDRSCYVFEIFPALVSALTETQINNTNLRAL